MKVLFDLFFEFLKIGLFAIGGGLAALPFLQKMSDKFPEWFSQQELIDMIAISESTPGPIGINTATYAGFNTAGIWGALVSVLGIVLPSFIIILIIAMFLGKLNENRIVKSVFYGIRPAVCALIGAAAYSVLAITLFDLSAFTAQSRILDVLNLPAILFFGVLLFAIMKFKKHPILYIAAAAVAGIFIPF